MNADFRRPLTLEEMIDACTAKMVNDAKENSDTVVEVILGPEVMLELALRVMALEARTGPSNRYLTDVEGAAD